MNKCARSSALAKLLIATLALSACSAAGARASEVVMLGDSWAAFIGDSVRATLNERGLRSTRIHNSAVPGSTADEWRRGVHGVVSKILAPDTNALVIQLFLGGNDILSRLPSTNGAASAVAPAMTNVIRVLRDVAAASAAPIVYSTYDFIPGPARTGGTALEINRWLVELATGVKALVKADPALKSRVTVLDTYGLMQIHYGIPKLGIPPFDPSLPNADLPGPSTAFADDIHLTRKGYDILFKKIYAEFYARILERSSLTTRRPGQVAVESAPGLRIELRTSPDLIAWSRLGVLTNVTGGAVFEDADLRLTPGSRFYQAVTASP